MLNKKIKIKEGNVLLMKNELYKINKSGINKMLNIVYPGEANKIIRKEKRDELALLAFYNKKRIGHLLAIAFYNLEYRIHISNCQEKMCEECTYAYEFNLM